MCGLFGYVGSAPPYIPLLHLIASEAGKRGPYAYGLLWIQDGEIKLHKTVGSIRHQLSSLYSAEASHLIMGHARLATSGSFRKLENNHPIGRDGIYVAHNGIVRTAYDSTQQQTDTDSEIIASQITSLEGELTDRVSTVIAQLELAPFALAVTDGQQVILARDGQPLYVLEYEKGLYYCSRPFPEANLLCRGIQKWE